MLLLDAHVHVYPDYDRGILLDSVLGNLSAKAKPEDSLAMVLVEREGVDVFGEWARGEGLPEGWSATPLDPTAVRLRSPSGGDLYAFAGRQIACAERLEILGVCTRAPVPDGVSCAEAIAAVRESGGVPVLAWGVGKWLFKRAKIVQSLLADNEPSALPLCDTSLRPVFWPRPAAMRGARPVLCGSDPLPRPGEEVQAGRYACAIPVDIGGDSPSALLRNAVAGATMQPVGHRSSPLEFLKRR